jgi:hypothetical protein
MWDPIPGTNVNIIYKILLPKQVAKIGFLINPTNFLQLFKATFDPFFKFHFQKKLTRNVCKKLALPKNIGEEFHI